MMTRFLKINLKMLSVLLVYLVICTSCTSKTEDTKLDNETIVPIEEYEKDKVEKMSDSNILLVGAEIKIKDEEGKDIITKEHVASSTLNKNYEGFYRIDVKLTSEGTKIFAEATEQCVGQVLEMWFDGKIYGAPVVQEAITSGEFCLSDGIEYEQAQEILARFAVHDRNGNISNNSIINYAEFWPDGYIYSLEKGGNWEAYLQKYKRNGRVYNEEIGKWVENDGQKFNIDGFYVNDAWVIREPRDYFYIGREGKKKSLGAEWYDFPWDRSLKLANAYPGTTAVRELNQENYSNGDLCLAIGYSQFLEIFGDNQFEIRAEMSRRDNPVEGHEFKEYLELTHNESGITAQLRNYYTKEETKSQCSYCIAVDSQKINSSLNNVIALLKPYVQQDTIMRAIKTINYGKNDEESVQFDGYYDVMTAYVRDGIIYIYNETWKKCEWFSGFSFS